MSKIECVLIEHFGGEAPGLNQRTFGIVVSTDRLMPSDRICPQESTNYWLTIHSLPNDVSGGKFLYDVKYMTSEPLTYFPLKYLRTGTPFMCAGLSDSGKQMLQHNMDKIRHIKENQE